MFKFKVVLMGDGAVGKSSLRRRFMGKTLRATYIMTIGADFAAKTMRVGDVDVRFVIWDLAGQPHFRTVRAEFYRGARGGLLVYDITRRKTFKNVPSWMEEFVRHARKSALAAVLVGNKVDLRGQAADVVSTEEGRQMAEELEARFGIPVGFVETSALTGENVDKAFMMLAEILLKILRASVSRGVSRH